jgi:hypothetical protein
MDGSMAALFGALIGGAGVVISQLVTARYAIKTDRMRLAIESGFRDWEAMREYRRQSGRPGRLSPLVHFIHFNNERSV